MNLPHSSRKEIARNINVTPLPLFIELTLHKSPMNNWQEEYLNIKSSLLKWSKHPKRAIIVLSLMYLFIPLRAKRVRRKQILLNEYQYTPFSAGNNYPDLHHLQGVLNLPNKFHLYVIICYWFIVIMTIKNPSSN